MVRFGKLAGGLARLPSGGVGAFGRYVRAMLGAVPVRRGRAARAGALVQRRADSRRAGGRSGSSRSGPRTPRATCRPRPDARVVFAADVLFIG